MAPAIVEVAAIHVAQVRLAIQASLARVPVVSGAQLMMSNP